MKVIFIFSLLLLSSQYLKSQVDYQIKLKVLKIDTICDYLVIQASKKRKKTNLLFLRKDSKLAGNVIRSKKSTFTLLNDNRYLKICSQPQLMIPNGRDFYIDEVLIYSKELILSSILDVR